MTVLAGMFYGVRVWTVRTVHERDQATAYYALKFSVLILTL